MTKNSRKPKLRPSTLSYLVRFLFYNVAFALLPLIVSLLLRWIAGISIPIGAYAQELLFFTVSVNATTLGDIREERFTDGLKWLYEILSAILLIVVIFAAILFGFYQYEAIVTPNISTTRNNMTSFSVWMAICTGAISFGAQWVVARIRN